MAFTLGMQLEGMCAGTRRIAPATGAESAARALKADIPELRGVEAVNLPPYTVLGWDEPDFIPIDLPAKDGAS